ncbi:NUDIX hydrolase [Stakelama tenebrarum]|uniref:NUDIX domain-containing protein n=1 Tax=Stakelama tenebrarum TaxID=2711215 RepID=A0A6G6Y8C2_9SPHN|nr:NUDIX domain-containing protein [Sphingosinithalassobacter tenebrarum]QIG81175.1 NUDIX domain-containing protein [Sphingosinithalassobacter tenebrarum]
MSPIRIVPAATLVLMRERVQGPPELLMVERAAAMSFAGGALVFPGGRIDPGDHALAARLGDTSEDAAARVAAIRETLEETGLAIGMRVDSGAVPQIRAALHDGTPFGEALDMADARLDAHALLPFARWCPDHSARVFDTRFYLARADAGLPDPDPDGSESTRAFWRSAHDVIAAAEAGEASVIYPTRRNLERLARFGGYEEAAAHAIGHPVRTITPWIETREDGDHLCIPDDLGYPVTSELLSRAKRAS